jgi:hypothetical protein
MIPTDPDKECDRGMILAAVLCLLFYSVVILFLLYGPFSKH